MDAWSHATAVPQSALACFFPCVIGLPLKGIGSASRFNPRTQLCAGIFSGLQTFLDVQASEFARLPGCSYRCAYRHRAAEAFTSGHLVLRCLRTLRICYPSEYRQLTVRGLSPRQIRSLVGRSAFLDPLFRRTSLIAEPCDCPTRPGHISDDESHPREPLPR